MLMLIFILTPTLNLIIHVDPESYSDTDTDSGIQIDPEFYSDTDTDFDIQVTDGGTDPR